MTWETRQLRLDLKLFEFSTSHQISLHVRSPGACLPSLGRPRCVTGLGSRWVAGRRAARDRLGCDVIRGLCVRAFRGSVGLGVPGKQGRDDEGAFGHMVRDLELQVHGSDLGGREDLRAVVEVA